MCHNYIVRLLASNHPLHKSAVIQLAYLHVVIVSTALQVEENATNVHTYAIKQYLHGGCVQCYLAAALALARSCL